MHEIHYRHHMSARVVQAVMAQAQVFQPLVSLCDTSLVPFLSWGEGCRSAPLGGSHHSLGLSGRSMMMCGMVWDHAVLGQYLSTALTFVPREGWLRCFGPRLFERQFLIINHAVGIQDVFNILGYAVALRGNLGDVYDFTVFKLPKVQAQGAVSHVLAGFSFPGVVRAISSHCLIMRSHHDVEYGMSTLVFLNGELPSLCSSLFKDTAPAKSLCRDHNQLFAGKTTAENSPKC
jgi:hypothetical protein